MSDPAPGVAGPEAEGAPIHVRVELDERSYDVLVGPGVRSEVARSVPPGARRATVVTQAGIDVAVDPGVPYRVMTIPTGERAKSLATVEEICRFMARGDMHRSDVVVAVGGGVVTDVAGYAASSYHRGDGARSTCRPPFSARSMPPSAARRRRPSPKARISSARFGSPQGVFCDTETLAGLPAREWRSGHGEMAKYAFLGVEDLDSLSLVEQVARCVACKAEVVAGDEREGGRRMVLNYGHTLAHALEAAGFASEDADSSGPELRHGEAVGIGLVLAAELAHLMGRIGSRRASPPGRRRLRPAASRSRKAPTRPPWSSS